MYFGLSQSKESRKHCSSRLGSWPSWKAGCCLKSLKLLCQFLCWSASECERPKSSRFLLFAIWQGVVGSLTRKLRLQARFSQSVLLGKVPVFALRRFGLCFSFAKAWCRKGNLIVSQNLLQSTVWYFWVAKVMVCECRFSRKGVEQKAHLAWRIARCSSWFVFHRL